jgi:hypothetical protein
VLLGWSPRHSFEKDMELRLKHYIASGRLEKQVDFSGDDKILKAVGYLAPVSSW